ncbi:MAG TPA: hypothetical protein VGF84_11515 [Micromonosporaceae bacterium]|jgi:hypothetical protein
MDLVEGMWASTTLAAAQELKLFPLPAGTHRLAPERLVERVTFP